MPSQMQPVFLAPDQAVMHRGRGATFLHMSRGSAIIRYWGDSHAVSVRPETLSLPVRDAEDEPMTRELGATNEPAA